MTRPLAWAAAGALAVGAPVLLLVTLYTASDVPPYNDDVPGYPFLAAALLGLLAIGLGVRRGGRRGGLAAVGGIAAALVAVLFITAQMWWTVPAAEELDTLVLLFVFPGLLLCLVLALGLQLVGDRGTAAGDARIGGEPRAPAIARVVAAIIIAVVGVPTAFLVGAYANGSAIAGLGAGLAVAAFSWLLATYRR